MQLGVTQFRIYLVTFAKHELSKWAAEKKRKKKKRKKRKKKKKKKETGKKDDFCESVISAPNENFR